MAVRKVAVMGHPVLRKQAAPVPLEKIKSPEIQSLIRDMIETMSEYDGRGIAAPQVYESLQITVLIWDFDPGQEPSLMCLINPVLKPATKEMSAYWEGCLSVPGLRGKVERPSKVTVEAYNQAGEKLSFTAEGFAATVLQHECDHLLGKLYVDRMTDFTQFAFTREYTRYIAPGEDPGEE